MSTLAAYASGALAVVERDARVYFTYKARVLGEVLNMALILTFFWFLSRLVSVEQFPTPADYFAFVLVGAVIFRTLISAFVTSSDSLRQELVAGTFERMAASPFGPTAGAASVVLFPFLLALILAFASIVVGALLFGVALSWSTLPLALPALVLAAVAFAPFSLTLNALVIAFKQAAGAGILLIFIPLVSGLLFPVDLLPGWLQWVSDVQPFTPAVDLLRHLIVGAPLQESVWTALAKIGVFAAILLPLSIGLIHLAVKFGRRRATLIEY